MAGICYKGFLSLFISFIITPSLQAQSFYSIGGSIHKGFIAQHTDAIGHLALSHPTGFEIYVKKHTYGKKLWQQLHNYPDVGFSVHYFDFKNPMLGKAVSVFSFIDFYIIKKKKSELIIKTAAGINYATNPYDRENNNKNVALGSTFAYAFQGRLSYNFQLIDRLKLTTALTLTHFSNGAFKKPNMGINIPTANIGLLYYLQKDKPAYIRDDSPPEFDSEPKFNIVFASGVKEIDVIGSGKFPFFTLSIYMDKQISPTNIINIGIDGFYNMATKEEIKIDRGLSDNDHPDFKRAGLVAGHEVLFGKVSLLTQLGIYLYRPYKSDKAIYQRYGLKYRITEQLFAGISLKSHYGKADAVEWGIGVRL